MQLEREGTGTHVRLSGVREVENGEPSYASFLALNSPLFALGSSLIAAQLDAQLRQLVAHFVQAGHAEVLAFQKIVAGLADQLADRTHTQANHALAGTYRKV